MNERMNKNVSSLDLSLILSLGLLSLGLPEIKSQRSEKKIKLKHKARNAVCKFT